MRLAVKFSVTLFHSADDLSATKGDLNPVVEDHRIGLSVSDQRVSEEQSRRKAGFFHHLRSRSLSPRLLGEKRGQAAFPKPFWS